MTRWPQYPTVYEINTWVWLGELSRKLGRKVDLSSVPPTEWDAITTRGFDAVWLMGVWERSPAGIAIANRNQGLLADFQRALPDFQSSDNVGSPYCIRQYTVDKRLGGTERLAVARQELAKRGVKLLLDFVPNHVAPDHPWVNEHLEYFISGSSKGAQNSPGSYIEVNDHFLACGRDPYFPAWPDVVQLNAFQPGLRQGVVETLATIAGQCDGVRCDMAMLLLNDVFERTWGSRAGQRPASEYWDDVIPVIKRAHPEFLFIAEAYWDMEWQLQQHGFDFCYDKRLYDRLEHESAESVRLHLCADLGYQRKLLRFLENHDEPRAASAFAGAKEMAAAVTTSTLPGARMFHEGQFEGRKVRLPVFLGRRPDEPVDSGLLGFYGKLLKAIDAPVFRDGQWRLCERSGWPDNSSYLNLVAWCWANDDARYLVIVNLSESRSDALVQAPWSDGAGKTWVLSDLMSEAVYERSGSEMLSPGLYVELEPWGYNLFQCRMTE
jgi:Alpha amylase, catalytic domain